MEKLKIQNIFRNLQNCKHTFAAFLDLKTSGKDQVSARIEVDNDFQCSQIVYWLQHFATWNFRFRLMIGNLVENESSRIVWRYRHLALSLETVSTTSVAAVLSVHPLARRFSDEVFLFAPIIMIQLKLKSKLHCKCKYWGNHFSIMFIFHLYDR